MGGRNRRARYPDASAPPVRALLGLLVIVAGGAVIGMGVATAAVAADPAKPPVREGEGGGAAPKEDSATKPGAELRLLDVRRISGDAPHAAFTDLARFKSEWVAVFREGKGHVSPDGAIRVLVSRDGREFRSAARLTASDADLRDPKLFQIGDELFIIAAAALHDGGEVKHRTRVFRSRDARDWSAPKDVGDPNVWIWRVDRGPDGKALAIGYSTVEPRFVRLYETRDGVEFRTVVERLDVEGYPNESATVFEPDGDAIVLLRRDPEPGLLGRGEPPYERFRFRELSRRIGGPELLRLDDGRLLAAVRLYDGKVRTALCFIDEKTGKLEEELTLPSGGDTSYAGLVLHEGVLYMSYYSSHEGRTAVYLARVALGDEGAAKAESEKR
ncbi:MAG TPA: exo-alpha-sialidase [Planctomycetota bacterium]|nr:exo-alpha-sialidase [Planctomycetota bacterium]